MGSILEKSRRGKEIEETSAAQILDPRQPKQDEALSQTALLHGGQDNQLDLQASFGNAAIARSLAQPNDDLSSSGSDHEQQSWFGNSLTTGSVMRKAKEGTSENEAATFEEMESSASMFVPSMFTFTPDVTNTTGLPGGWQKTAPVTLKFFYMPKGSFPEWLKCTIIVGVPIRNYLGPIDPDWAAICSANSAIAAHNVLKERPNWFGFNFCKEFRNAMEKDLGLLIDGARVTPAKGF